MLTKLDATSLIYEFPSPSSLSQCWWNAISKVRNVTISAEAWVGECMVIIKKKKKTDVRYYYL